MINRYKELLPDKIINYNCNIVIEPSLAKKSPELIDCTDLSSKHNLIVCDQATYIASGKRLIKELGCNFLLLDDKPHADEANISIIRSKQAEALIAVGSGTISDLCKYSSFLDKKPYVVFPTAPSMNGYFSANASITVNGHKQTLPAHLPQGIFCDLEVLAKAPKRLILSGLGDSLCRTTAQADWLLSHLLFKTAYNPLPFDLLKPYEYELFSNSDKLCSGDIGAIGLLIKTLLISGAGMVIAGGSYPASQAEHLIAHTMEMKYGSKLPETYHGEQIGVTTLIMAAIQRQFISGRLILNKVPRPEKAITDYFGVHLAESVISSFHHKLMFYEKYDAISEIMEKEDSHIRDAIRQVMVHERDLRSVLQKAGAITTASGLGWNDQDIRQATYHAKFIRDRFTFLDLLAE